MLSYVTAPAKTLFLRNGKGQLRKRFKDKDREVRQSLKSDKKKWLEGIASEAEEEACSQHMKTLHGLTKKLCDERPNHGTVVLDKHWNLFSKKDEVQKCWTEHLGKVLTTSQLSYRRQMQSSLPRK